jgi:ureidoacrylate peracid hydrolase
MTGQTPLKLSCRYYRNYPPGRPLGHTEEELTLGRDDTVFLLVDVYGRGFDEDDDLGTAPELYSQAVEANRELVVSHMKPAQQAARRLGLPIVYVTNYLSPALNERTEWRNVQIRAVNVDVLTAWTDPNDILVWSKIIAPEPGDYVIKKQVYSGFFETQLDSLLTSLNARNLVTVGFDSRVCLGTTVIDAMYRNYRVIVLRDCTSTAEYAETEEGQWANFIAIRFIENAVGYTSTAAQWISACEAALA